MRPDHLAINTHRKFFSAHTGTKEKPNKTSFAANKQLWCFKKRFFLFCWWHTRSNRQDNFLSCIVGGGTFLTLAFFVQDVSCQ